MKLFLTNLLLALAWVALTGNYAPPNFAAGFLIAFVILFLFSKPQRKENYFFKVIQVVRFFFFYLWELILANLKVAYDVATRGYNMKPAIIGIPLDAKTDAEIVLLANLITLTPGTLSIDVSSDRKVLFIHAMYIEDRDLEAFKKSIKEGLERRVIELLR